jgi:hypothetical protein
MTTKVQDLNYVFGPKMDDLTVAEMNEFERRSRLVSLTYEVLRGVQLPEGEATTKVMLSVLTQAFLEKAAALAKLEGATHVVDVSLKATLE